MSVITSIVVSLSKESKVCEPYRITVSTTGGYMWMNRLVTLSSEWKTKEFLHVMMALARGPIRYISSYSLIPQIVWTYLVSIGNIL